MKRTKRVCDAAVEVLRETDNPAVMWGDCGLLCMIAKRSGVKWEHPMRGEERVLQALSRQPGVLVKGFAAGARGRSVRIFRLPEKVR